MAFVAQGFQVVLNLKDKTGGNGSNVSFELPGAADYAAAVAAAGAVATNYAAVTNSWVSAYYVNRKFANDTGGPYGTGLNASQAILVTQIDAAEYKTHNFKIINPTEAIQADTEGPNSLVVDTLDANVLALLELFTTTDGVLLLSDGETLDDTTPLISGRVKTRKS